MTDRASFDRDYRMERSRKASRAGHHAGLAAAEEAAKAEQKRINEILLRCPGNPMGIGVLRGLDGCLELLYSAKKANDLDYQWCDTAPDQVMEWVEEKYVAARAEWREKADRTSHDGRRATGHLHGMRIVYIAYRDAFRAAAGDATRDYNEAYGEVIGGELD